MKTSKRDNQASGSSSGPPGQSPPPTASAAAASTFAPGRPLRNAERIAADRQKITDGGVLDILLDHVRGAHDLSPSQVSTAFGLLKKILPDFSPSLAPRDSEEGREGREDGAWFDPDFEIHIVDPKEA